MTGPVEPSTPWGPYPWEHQPQPDRPSTPWGPYPWELNPDAPQMPGSETPPASGSGGAPTATDASHAFDTGKFLLWLGALAALWLILSALQDAGYPQLAHGMAGLILFGALLTLGPKAIENAKTIFNG